MNRFMSMQRGDFEQLHYFYDAETKMKAVLCIHDTTLGPAIGGIKLLPIKLETTATEIAMKNAKLMTYKSALAGVDLGGCSMVVLGEPEKVKTEFFLRTIGRKIESLKGRVRLVGDANITTDDMDFIHMETQYADEVLRGKVQSTRTTLGVIKGLEACLKYKYGEVNFKDKKVVVQGIGRTGGLIAEILVEQGANVFVSDIDDAKLEGFSRKHNVTILSHENAWKEPCDVFMPCSIEEGLKVDMIEALNCKIIAGSANNILEKDKCGRLLKARDILYAPDYVVNSGGLISVYEVMMKKKPNLSDSAINRIPEQLNIIFQLSDKMNISTNAAADRLALERLNFSRHLRANFMPK